MMGDCQIRVVAFDAVGTLIYPEPSVAQVYFDIGQRHGSRLTKIEIEARFVEAFRIFDRDNAAHGFRTSESREREIWQEVVATVLTDVESPEDCFAELFDWFACGQAWRVFDDVASTFAAIRAKGVRIAIASNFDSRLHAICDGFEELKPIRIRCISSEVGHRKPSRGYYDNLAKMCDADASEILMVGDTQLNDVEGAVEAGFRATLIDRGQDPKLPTIISSLTQVTAVVEA